MEQRDPFTDRGPDPHLNLDGVRLSGGERRKLAIVAMLVAGALALVVGGIAYGLGPQPSSGPQPFQVVVSGRGSAIVTVVGGDGGSTEVELPHTVAVGADTSAIDARSLDGATIACDVLDSSGTVLRSARGASVRCDAVAR